MYIIPNPMWDEYCDCHERCSKCGRKHKPIGFPRWTHPYLVKTDNQIISQDCTGSYSVTFR